MPKILVIEDEPPLAEALAYHLRREGFDTQFATDGEAGLEQARAFRPDLILLDLMLPGRTGLEVCQALRREGETPIIFLTAKSSEADKLVGFALGADDYITKPFSMHEFRSRVKAALRRAGMSRAADVDDGEAPIEVGDLRVEPSKRTVTLRSERVDLTFVEFEILVALAGDPGRVFTREALLTRIWGDSAYRDPRTIDVHIRHLREKLEADAKRPDYLFTVRGVGYRFRDDEQGPSG